MNGHDYFKALLAAGFVVALCIYVTYRLLQRRLFHLDDIIEGSLCGCAIAAGIHLVFCAFKPEHLVEIFDANGQIHKLPPGAYISMDAIHFIHILAGGVATAFLGGVGLHRACTKP